MDVLSIGNSFSEDSQRYLNGIAKADGVELNTFNLYISTHSNNFKFISLTRMLFFHHYNTS